MDCVGLFFLVCLLVFAPLPHSNQLPQMERNLFVPETHRSTNKSDLSSGCSDSVLPAGGSVCSFTESL